MGTDGVSSTHEKIFGSHTLRVIRNVDSPLLIIPEKVKFHSLRRLLLTLDFSVDFNHASLQPLLNIIGNHSFSLDILHLGNSEAVPEGEEKELKDDFEIYNPSYHMVSDVPAHEAIKTIVQTMKIDMNVLPVKKEEFLERLLGSKLTKIISSTTVPLFILHSKREDAKE